MLEAKAPLSIDNFDACDYIFLNHAHPDHYLNIKEFVDKFPPDLCGQPVCGGTLPHHRH